MPTATTVRSQQGDTVDLVAYRHYGRTADVTEAVFAANARLADLGVILPLGTVVVMPVFEERPVETSGIRLWE